MKKFKIVGVTILSLLLIIYIAFFIIIPNLVNLNKYKPSIQKIVSDSAALNIDYDDMHLYATPNFSLKILLKNLKIKYPKGNEIINLDKAETTIPLFPIFAKTLRISSVNLNGISLSLNIDEKGHYDLEKYIIEQINKNKEKETSAVKQLPIKYSPEMPKITLKNYIISVEDNKNKLLSKLQGDIIKIDDFNLEKHIKIAANGLLTENDKKQITYNIKVNSYIPQATNEEQTHFELPEELFNPFLQIAKYNFNAELTSDLKITQNKDKNSINGILNLDKISFKSQGTMLPESYLHLNFKNDDIKIDSDFYTAKNEKTDIIGEINLGKKTNIYSEMQERVISAFEKNIDKLKLIRRVSIEFCNISPEKIEQFDMFSDPQKILKEKNLTKSIISIHEKFGKNALLKGIDLNQSATQRERNKLIGGHNSGEN